MNKLNQRLTDISKHFQAAMEICNRFQIQPSQLASFATHCSVVTTSMQELRDMKEWGKVEDIKIEFASLKNDVYGTIFKVTKK